jgi:hypothetical protein
LASAITAPLYSPAAALSGRGSRTLLVTPPFVCAAPVIIELRSTRAGRKRAMIYMVEMDFPHPEREAEWHAWYLAHVRVLQTVPGFRASQRFKGIVDMPAPYLALHEVESAALFDSPAYRSRGGPASTGEWRTLQTNWSRNLLAGIDDTPDVPANAYVVLLYDARDAGFPIDAPIHWLRGAGLDSTITEVGLAVIGDPTGLIEIARRDERVRIYRPISEKIRTGA